MTTVRLPTRVRRSHLGCRIEERMISTDGQLVHHIALSCPTPYLAKEELRLELAKKDSPGKDWHT